MREVFRLVGLITMKGVEDVEKHLKAVDRQAQKAARQIDKFGRDVSKVGSKLSVGLTVPLAALGAAAWKGVESLSDLGETTSKVGELFGQSAGDIQTWANTAAGAIGQSKQQAMDAASTFAIFGKSAGLAGGDLVQFSTQFTELASDLASFNNTTPEEAITAIGAALRGENEPIRRYGVLLDAATMKQKALELGIIDTISGALTPQQKVLAASALIMEQTSDAQGDFQRTSGQLANQQRILKAEIENLTAEVGKAFLPIVQDAIGLIRGRLLPAVAGLVDWFNRLSPEMKETIVYVAGLTAALGPALIVAGKMISMLKILPGILALATGGMHGLNAAMRANLIGIVVTAVYGLIVAGIALYKNWDKVKTWLLDAWDAIVYGIQQSISFLKEMYIRYIKLYVDGINLIARYIPILNKAVGWVEAGLDSLIEKEKESRQVRREARQESEAAKKAARDLAAAKKEAAAAAQAQADAEKMLTETQREQAATTLAQTDLTRQVAQEKISISESVGDREKEVASDITAAVKKSDADQLKSARRLAEERMRLYRMQYQAAVQSINEMFSVLRMGHDNEMIRLDQEMEKRREQIEETVVGEQEKQDALAAVDKEHDERRVSLQREQAQREKTAAIFNIMVSTAEAVMKAWAQLGPIAGPVMAGIATALGAAKIAMVQSRPLPMAEGGLVKRRRGGVFTQVGEGGEDELVFPLKTGVRRLVDEMAQRVNEIRLPGIQNVPGAAAAGGPQMHWHIGALIADESGIKQLERRMYQYRISEERRRGR